MNNEDASNPVLAAAFTDDGKFSGNLTYTRKLKFDFSLVLSSEHKDNIRAAELTVNKDVHDITVVHLLITRVEKDGAVWTEDKSIFDSLDEWDGEVAFGLFSEVLPNYFPKIQWTFTNYFA